MNHISATYRLIKSLLVASLAPILIGFVFFEPIKSVGSDIALRMLGAHADALIISAEEEIDSDDSGRTLWFNWATYSFKTETGEVIYGKTNGTGRLRKDLIDIKEPVPAIVEYLPSSPSINRLRSNRDPIPIPGLLIRTLIALAVVGFFIWSVYRAILEFRKDQRVP